MGKFMKIAFEPLAEGFAEGIYLFAAIVLAPFRTVLSFIVHQDDRASQERTRPAH